MADRPLILVVEDDFSICEMMKAYLEYRDYRVVTAYDGVAGEEILRATHPDLVITDVRLGGTSGEELSKVAGLIGVPVLLMSGHFETTERLKDGPVTLLRKPFKMSELEWWIERLLPKR